MSSGKAEDPTHGRQVDCVVNDPQRKGERLNPNLATSGISLLTSKTNHQTPSKTTVKFRAQF